MNTKGLKRNSRRRGFTLVELVIVLTIIGILAGSGIYLVVGFIDDAKVERVRGDLNALDLAIQAYSRNNNFQPPTQEQGLKALSEKPSSDPVPARWRAYLEEPMLDPWGQEYRFRRPATQSNKKYDIYSVGEDLQEGTEDDLGNWSF